MTFQAKTFLENVERWVAGPARDQLAEACKTYFPLTTPEQRAGCIRGMMAVLDYEVDVEVRRAIMEACGRNCIGASTLEKASQLQREAQDLDDLLNKLNQAHIGGGKLRREGDVISAVYESCYCGSVNKAREPISATYCLCSCGWYRQLFETHLEEPVEIELLSSIIQGDDRCQFLIRI